MIELVLLLATVFDPHTITFDEVVDVDHYVIRQRTHKPNLIGRWDLGYLAWTCTGSPCALELRLPSPGNVVYISVAAVSSDGVEGVHRDP